MTCINKKLIATPAQTNTLDSKPNPIHSILDAASKLSILLLLGTALFRDDGLPDAVETLTLYLSLAYLATSNPKAYLAIGMAATGIQAVQGLAPKADNWKTLSIRYRHKTYTKEVTKFDFLGILETRAPDAVNCWGLTIDYLIHVESVAPQKYAQDFDRIMQSGKSDMAKSEAIQKLATKTIEGAGKTIRFKSSQTLLTSPALKSGNILTVLNPDGTTIYHVGIITKDQDGTLVVANHVEAITNQGLVSGFMKHTVREFIQLLDMDGHTFSITEPKKPTGRTDL